MCGRSNRVSGNEHNRREGASNMLTLAQLGPELLAMSTVHCKGELTSTQKQIPIEFQPAKK